MLKVYITLAAFMALAAMCYTAPVRNQKFSFHVGIGKQPKHGSNDFDDFGDFGDFGNFGNYGKWYKQLMAAVQAKLRVNAAKAQHHPNHITSSRPSYDYPGSLQTREQHKSAETQDTDVCLMVKTKEQCRDLCKTVLPKDHCDRTYPMVSSQNDEFREAAKVFLAKLQAAVPDEDTKENDEE